MKFGKRWRDLESELESHQRLAESEQGRRPGAIPDRVREATRDQWAWVWLDDLVRDLRFGARGLRRNPGFAAVAVATIALGIGAATLMFSLVNSVLLRPLPFVRAGALVVMTNYLPKGALVYLRNASREVEWAGCGDDRGYTLLGAGAPALLTGAPVSANFFSLLGARAALGRTFATGEDLPGRDAEVILSQQLWRDRFHADPAILGRTLNLGGAEREVVGVMPAGFQLLSAATQLWVPLHLAAADTGDYWGGSYMLLFGRRRAGSLDQARSEWQALRPQLVAHWGWPMRANSYAEVTLAPLQAAEVGYVAGKLWLLLGAVGLLLLIACVNVASLLLVRGAAREREMAVRAALGAARGRLVRQLLVESLLLAGLGGALGLALAVLGLPALKAVLPSDLPRLAEVGLDVRVLLSGLGVALLAGIGFGLGPAWQRARSGRARARLRSALVMGEVALSVVLVVAAGLTVRSLWNLANETPGFLADRVLTARITPSVSFCAVPGRCQAFYDRLLAALRAQPGVKVAAAANNLPLEGGGETIAFWAADRALPPGAAVPLAWDKIVTPGYLGAMGIPLLRGRAFTPADAAPGAAPVVLVSQATAARFWPGQNAVGRYLQIAGYRAPRRVVGVVANTREDTMATDTAAWISGMIYCPYGPEVIRATNATVPPAAMTVVVRVTGAGSISVGELRKLAGSLEPDAAVGDVKPLPAVVAAALAEPRSISTVFALFAVLALLLGAIGLYGLLAYFVAGRTREIGVRMALGAGRARVLGEVVGRGARLAVLGVAAGLAGAFLLTRLMAGLLYGVSPTDPWVFAAVAALWVGVALLASFIPARRATRVDPARALRAE